MKFFYSFNLKKLRFVIFKNYFKTFDHFFNETKKYYIKHSSANKSKVFIFVQNPKQQKKLLPVEHVHTYEGWRGIFVLSLENTLISV